MGNRCSFSSNNQDGGIMADVVDPSGSSVGNGATVVSAKSAAAAIPANTSQRESIQNNTKNIEKKNFEEKSYCDDSVVNSVIEEFISRSNFGKLKYGVTLDREDLSLKDWIQHMQEELMDAILYLEKIKKTTNSMCPNLIRQEMTPPPLISPTHPHPFFTKMPPELFTPPRPESGSPLIVYEDQDQSADYQAQPKVVPTKNEFKQFI